MKFKVGDKVRVLETSYPNNCPIGFETTILSIDEDGVYLKGNGYDSTPESWYFHNTEKLELVQEMNKYNIEVGDYVRGKNDNPDSGLIVGVFKSGISYTDTNSNYTPVSSNVWDKVNNRLDTGEDIHIKSNKMNKKIIGYKLLKDTPEHEAGDTFMLDRGGNYSKNGDAGTEFYYTKENVEAKPQFFEPIYETKPTEVFVDTLAGKVKVFKENSIVLLSLPEEKVLSQQQVESVFGKLQSSIGNLRGFDIKVETFKVGCKTFSVSDIPKLQAAIKEVE